MELAQRVVIPRPIEEVWQALNDPDVLRQSIPGCESFDPDGDAAFDIVLKAKVGPVSATFRGEVSMSDVVDGKSYTLTGSGKGGVAGHARGSAAVQLISVDENSTSMQYRVHASVGGKLAQIGSRLVDGAARKMANEFFTHFIRVLCEDERIEVQLETIEV